LHTDQGAGALVGLPAVLAAAQQQRGHVLLLPACTPAARLCSAGAHGAVWGVRPAGGSRARAAQASEPLAGASVTAALTVAGLSTAQLPPGPQVVPARGFSVWNSPAITCNNQNLFFQAVARASGVLSTSTLRPRLHSGRADVHASVGRLQGLQRGAGGKPARGGVLPSDSDCVAQRRCCDGQRAHLCGK
jgi:hypothetical protein